MKSRINRPLPPNRVSRLPPINTSALDTPERVVDYCKSKGLISDDGAVDIERLIAEDANLKLIREDLGDKDASIEHIGDKFIIKVNSRHPKTRQRFSMAHEYAHYQLHRHMIKEMPVGEKIMFRDGASMPVEWQANRFAASVLMPFSAVNVALKRSNDDRILAARLLQVSLQALDYRIEQMGEILIVADDYFVLARTGQSEMRALRNLKKEDRVKFTTLLELTRGRKRASKHIKDGDEIYNFSAIQDFLHDYYVEGMMMFVDLTRDQDLSSPRIDALASSSDGYAEWISFVNGVKEKCPGICPVIQVSPEDGESWDSYGEKILEQFEALSSNFPALAYRVRKNIDDSFDADLELLSSRIRRYTDSGFKFYFILDYEYIRVNTAELHSLEAASIIQVVNEICPTADIVLAATSFPSSVTDIGNEDRGDFPIEEVKFFELVANRLSNIVKIHYGDYGSIHPIRNDAVARGWRPRIDYPYAGRKVFYFREKREAKTIEANGSKSVVYSDYISHYCSVARKIYTDQRFLNDQHSSDITSWGISEIANAAENRVGGSTPSYWISVRMCIHIEQQLLRLSA